MRRPDAPRLPNLNGLLGTLWCRRLWDALSSAGEARVALALEQIDLVLHLNAFECNEMRTA
jgi:hypothetical protein